jgi:hypothetical protein
MATAKELQRCREFDEPMAEFRAGQPESSASFPSAEPMIREDWDR